jgi:uncharacterized damage-inducible protein DinB
MSVSSLLLSLFKYKAWANEELFAELEKLDEAQHGSERRTAILLLDHIHVVDQIFAGHLSGAAHDHATIVSPETPSLGDLREAVQASDRWYVDYVANIAPEQLSEKIEFTFTDGEMGGMTREEMLSHIITHGNYHRGAVGVLMNQASVPPPDDIFTVFLHRSEPDRRVPKA